MRQKKGAAAGVWKTAAACAAGLLCLSGCDLSASVPDGRIEFKNHLSGDRFNHIRVTGGGLSRVLGPRQHVLFPSGTRVFHVSYYDGKRTRKYQVDCPSVIGKGVRIILLDVYMNRMRGGCTSSVE